MGLKKHKKHKSEKRDRTEELPVAEKPPGLKIILKVGGNISTPEHSNDSAPMTFGNMQGSIPGLAQMEEESLSLASAASGSHSDRHKKLKKKKKKKEKEKSKEKHEKKHKHRHKEKRKRPHDESTLEEINVGDESSVDIIKKPHIDPAVAAAPTPVIALKAEQPTVKPSSPRAPVSKV